MPLRADPVDAQRLGDRSGHGVARVERRVRVLEHGLDTPPERHQVGPVHRREVGAVEADRSRRRRFQAEQQVGGGRLARTRLADDRDRRAPARSRTRRCRRRPARSPWRATAPEPGSASRPGRRVTSGPLDAAHRRRHGVAIDRVVRLGAAREQRLGVLVLRRGEDLRGRAGLDDLAPAHHRHPVGALGARGRGRA